MKFKTRFNVDEFPRVCDLVCELPSMTQQQFKAECDINTIVNRYKVTGVLGDPTDIRKPSYGDFSTAFDFMEAQNTIIRAQEQFEALPSEIRKRFDNNPASMLKFLENPNNREEAIKLGIVQSDNSMAAISSDVSSSVVSDVVAAKEN